MKLGRVDVRGNATLGMELRFETQDPTSYSGLILFLFHEGRGSQEGIFAELEAHCQMGYVPVKTRVGNQLYMFAGILAHNLARELQMRLNPRERRTTAKRAALWCFREVETLRRTLIQRAGRIIRPAGKLILSMNSNARLEGELRHALAALNAGA